MSEMASAILSPPSQIGPLQNYYFPNNMFNRAELCSLFQMLSYNLYDTTQYPRNASLSKLDILKNQQFTDNMATNSLFLPDQSPIKEEGVVSFRSNKVEAIQMSRVLIGVIAGLSGADAKSQPKDILKAIRPLYDLPNDYDKAVDPVMMVTLADLYGVSAKYNLNEQKKYYFGLSGEWSDQSCTTDYVIGGISVKELNSSRNYVHATRAEIRGGIDGYKIGTALKNLVGKGGVIDVTKLRLSQILRSYYSKPQSQISSSTFSVSYCDRTSQINIQDVENQANIYAAIVSIYKSMVWPPELNQDFKLALTASQSIENTGYNEYCNKPSGIFNRDSPCETPSDVIYFIDGTTLPKMHDSALIIGQLNGNLNGFSADGGTVSIFFNSQQKSTPNPDVELPIGTGQDQWPLTAASFNSSNTGCAQCRIYDFNTTLPQAVSNTGKYLRYLNATLFGYQYWTPRVNQSWLPSKSAVLIDFNSVMPAPDKGQDKNDYKQFKNQLKNKNRDVLFISLATNNDLFKDILRDQDKDRVSPSNIINSAWSLAQRICDNPATFQYNMCHHSKSNNQQYMGFITPGYKQNWAMYPEFFHKSSSIKFQFKAVEGNIRVCFDRTFPPEKRDLCFDTNDTPIIEFKIKNPCKGKTVESCHPLYFTVWGKDKTSDAQCLDARCQTMNQIKWTATHSGVHCK